MQQHIPHLDESTSASPTLSPGPVRDQETLLRIIIEPDHIREGRMQPSAVQLRDLTHRGLSVHRKEHTTRNAVDAIVQALLGRPTAAGMRSLEGLASFNTGAVRSIGTRVPEEKHRVSSGSANQNRRRGQNSLSTDPQDTIHRHEPTRPHTDGNGIH